MLLHNALFGVIFIFTINAVVSESCDCKAGVTGSICQGPSSFGYCVSGKIIATGSCADGELCNEKMFEVFNKICVLKSTLEDLGLNATCLQGEPTVPQPPVNEFDLQKECNNAGLSGRYYYIPKDGDTTCTQYIYCEKVSNGYIVFLNTCEQPTKYFDRVTQKCVAKRPEDC